MADLADLGPGTVALYTLVSDTTYRVILITPDTQVARDYPITAADLNRKVLALREAHRLGAQEIDLRLDSKLIVEQLSGRWRVKDAKLIPLWAAARGTLGGFRRWTAAHVPRAQNSVADALCNEAIDRAQAGGPASVVRRPGD